MINADMRLYNYFTYTDSDGYGQLALTEEPVGKVKMAINISSQGVQDNVLYKDCSFVGLTNDTTIDDTFVIEYENQKLKVLYVNPKGRFAQVFLKGM